MPAATAEQAPFDKILSDCDIITFHLSSKEKMVTKKEISKMKTGVILINTSRGTAIDEDCLYEGLVSGKIGFAGLDVYEEESEYFFEDLSGEVLTDDVLARLLTFNNVIITAHQAFFTREAMMGIAETTLQNIRNYFEGKPLPNEICYQCPGGKENCRKEKEGRCF